MLAESFISVPKITLADDLDVESWTVNRYSRRNLGMCSSQSFCYSLTTFRKYSSRVLLNRSTILSDCGVARVFSIPYTSHISLKTADSNVVLLEHHIGHYSLSQREHIRFWHCQEKSLLRPSLFASSSYWTFSCNTLGTVSYLATAC